MNRSRKSAFALVGVVALVIAAIAVWVRSTIDECAKLQEVPSVPIYPGSVLLEHRNFSEVNENYSLLFSMLVGTDSWPMLVSVEYSAEASVQNIIDFYVAQTANCRGFEEGSSRVVCHEYLEPTGSYSVYIEKGLDVQRPQVFTLEIRWSACGSFEDL